MVQFEKCIVAGGGVVAIDVVATVTDTAVIITKSDAADATVLDADGL